MISLVSLISSLAAQGSPPAAVQSVPQPSSSPAAIFRRVCLEGGITFEGGAAVPVNLDDLPRGLRSALDAYASDTDLPEPFRRYRRLGREQIPNGFFRLRSSPAYLMAPRTDASPKSTGRQCAVFWRGNHWAELRETLRPWIVVPDPAAPRTAFMGRVSIHNVIAGHRISLANYGDWTMMRTMPVEVPEPVEQAS